MDWIEQDVSFLFHDGIAVGDAAKNLSDRSNPESASIRSRESTPPAERLLRCFSKDFPANHQFRNCRDRHDASVRHNNAIWRFRCSAALRVLVLASMTAI
jgi:hypothetical protein